MIGPRVGVRVGARVGSAVGSGEDDLGSSAINLIVIAGQSNARGNGDVDDVGVPAGLGEDYANVQIQQKWANGVANPIVWAGDITKEALQPRTAGGAFGVELSLGRYLDTRYPNRWAIAKMSLDSSGLNVHWRPGSTYPSSTSPPNLFSLFITYIHSAIAAMGARMAALVWVGGEQDAGNSTNASAYAENTTDIITGLRAVFGAFPFVYNQLHVDASPAETATVRSEQATYDAADALATMVDCDDLVLTDGLHYDSPSLAEMGDRFGAEILTLMGLPT